MFLRTFSQGGNATGQSTTFASLTIRLLCIATKERRETQQLLPILNEPAHATMYQIEQEALGTIFYFLTFYLLEACGTIC
ncbi:hypothetical protein CJ255_21365 [Candidatus Viridilinea mediisalina]|uniref:Uncharacterized protein n=1 Tax=Candidatus Viridilinea mediisalina TaxID=2024553 RepID=A0A2A6RDD3_9CHLR|nr:hypothetical protein CJ255_21365 [Candidatus Viridilinea mediisalina]